MNRLLPGNVVIAKIPYSNCCVVEERPALIISSRKHNAERRDALVVMISSQPVRTRYEYGIKDWLYAGLKRPSKVVCDHIATIEQDSLVKIGQLKERELVEVKKVITRIIEA